MNTGKIYKDADDNDCTLLQLIRRDPHWAASRIQEGEKAIEKLQQQKPLSEDEIVSIGFKSGFHVDTIEDDETGEELYGFIDEDGNVDNECFIKFARLIEKKQGIGDVS